MWVNTQVPGFRVFTLKKNGDNPPEFMFTDSRRNSWFLMQYKRNKLYPAFYAIYLAVFIILWLIFYLSQKIRTQRLERENQRLNQAVEAQTEELQQQNEQLHLLHQFKDDMVAMLVHDLKNPLNAISNIAMQDAVRQSAADMLRLVNNLLDISKFEEAKMQVEPSFISPKICIESAIKQVKYLLRQKNLSIDVDLQCNFSVQADKILLERVFVNLLNNAAKFSPNNEAIKIVISDCEDDKNFCRISISDKGTGVPEEVKHKIFEKYSSVSKTETQHKLSTGLGLAFCKLATEAMSGQIKICRETKEGACFFLKLPKGKPLSLSLEETTQSYSNQQNALTLEEQKYLSEFVDEIKNVPFYKISEHKKILKKISDIQSSAIKKWCEDVEVAVMSNNKERFLQLLEL